MHFKIEHPFPHCPPITRTVQVGGLTKAELLEALRQNAIAMNEYAERLFANDRFTTAGQRRNELEGISDD